MYLPAQSYVFVIAQFNTDMRTVICPFRRHLVINHLVVTSSFGRSVHSPVLLESTPANTSVHFPVAVSVNLQCKVGINCAENAQLLRDLSIFAHV